MGNNRDTVIIAGAKVLENRRMRWRASEVLDFIEDAEKKQVKDPQVKSWLQGIKDLCYELIDVSEEFELEQQAKKLRFVGLQHFNGNVKSIIREFEILIKKVDELNLIGSSSELPVPEAELEPQNLHSNITGKELMVGRDAEIQDLIRRLTKEYHRCICLVGEEVGIGRTALARHVYNSSQVQSKFHFMAWVTVSQQFNVKRIVKTMLEFAPEKPEYVGDEFELLELELHKFIVTRENKVAEVAKEVAESTHTVFMTSLSPEACWSIMKHHAFGDDLKNESSVERIFGQVGRKIAEKCPGKPVVARSLGVMLRGRSHEEWHDVLMSEKLSGYDLKSLPMLSEYLYSRMPPALRQCLLYCSIFPKNHSIQVDKLVKLWMAQGFIASHEEDKMEIQGWKYVKQLRDCSAFQEFELDGEGAFVCKLEEEMHEFIQDLAQNECHIVFLDEETTMEKSGDSDRVTQPPHCRHCTLCLQYQTSFPDSIDNGGKLKAGKLHTLMVLSESSDIDPTNLASLLCLVKRIRALDLSSCAIKELPLKAAELLHLRYLNLSFNHELKKLPSAISNLLNLQTLNLNGCDSLQKLPKSIGKLIKLRHLEILWTTSLSYLPKGIASLTLLRTLNRFFGSSGGASRSKACSLGDLENLNNIEGCLTIDGLGGETEISEATRAGLRNKKNLLGLELWFSIVGLKANDEVLLDSLEAPPQLQLLGIFYYGGSSFPNWMIELNELKHLMLVNCSKCNVLPPLGKLPFLESLEIKNMPNVKMVGFEFLGIGLNHEDAGNEGSSSDAIAFPRLSKLHFIKLDEWEEWTELNGNVGDEKIMPLLSSLSVVYCEKLESLPDYIDRKKNLTQVIEGCPLLPEKKKKVQEEMKKMYSRNQED
ncbi:putative disease resistance RPP13-like protein 1 [Arachis duranensis]|uniref:Disease resistance RPP13-like protein 1 n=1 Tax=Arachis duranensis TaxID=130453 RepID=A0A6P4C0Z1_ARADU|nr:putative disease resistance RPP13-like protein 1 [Arachis duranensis]XP_052112782.1 putative disease resistance RPP13-like protein 1 [Arachis duranensis]